MCRTPVPCRNTHVIILYISWLVVWNIFYFPRTIGNFIIPVDFHIFQRGGSTTNQILVGWLYTQLYHVISISSKIDTMDHGTSPILMALHGICPEIDLLVIISPQLSLWKCPNMPLFVEFVCFNHVKTSISPLANLRKGHLRHSSVDDSGLLRGPGDLPGALVELHLVLWHPLLLHRDPTAPWHGTRGMPGKLARRSSENPNAQETSQTPNMGTVNHPVFVVKGSSAIHFRGSFLDIFGNLDPQKPGWRWWGACPRPACNAHPRDPIHWSVPINQQASCWTLNPVDILSKTPMIWSFWAKYNDLTATSPYRSRLMIFELGTHPQ